MAFAPSKARRLKTKREPTVSLNSMMDMMTIILLFLLKSYSTSGALMQPNLDNLPKSILVKEPKKSLAVIVDLEAGVLQDVEKGNKPVLASLPELADSVSMDLPDFEAYLLDIIALDERLGKKEITHILTVEAAEDIPYSWILKIVNTATTVGFDTFEFVVTRINA